jgi:hypothetical protein
MAPTRSMGLIGRRWVRLKEEAPWEGIGTQAEGLAAAFGRSTSFPLGPALPWHPIPYRMRLDHPVDHPDDPTGSFWSRLDRRGTQREQARSVWSRPDRRRAPGYGSGGWGSNPSRRAQRPRSATRGCLLCLPRHHLCPSGWGIKEPPGDQEARQPLVGRRVCRPRAAHRTEAPDEGPRTCRPGWRCTVRAGVRRPAGRGPGPPLPPLLLVVGRFWLPPPVGDPTGSAAGCQPAQSSASGGSGGAARCGRTGLDS